MNEKFWWYVALTISLVLIGTILFLWDKEIDHHEPALGQLTDSSAVEKYLKRNTATGESHILIPTGIFIQSLKFLNASDANITGYIWQKYGDDVPADISRDFIFPEQVSSGDTVKKRGVQAQK